MRTSSKGFTLIEVMIATMVLAGGILVMANAWSGNFMRVRNARVNNTMAALLERKMTEYEIRAKEKGTEEIPEEDAGDFGKQFPGYRWEMKATKFEMPNVTGSLSSREGGVDQMTIMIVQAVSGAIKEVVKEMSVSVYFKGRAGNEIKHTATTYLIDYTKEIQLPGMPSGMPGAGGAAGALGGGP